MENKRTAHWAFYIATYYNKRIKYSICSYCLHPVNDWTYGFNYCPHCGAEMSEKPIYEGENYESNQ